MAKFRFFRFKSIRTVLVLPVILSFVIATALVTVLVYNNSQKALNSVLAELQQTMIVLVTTDMNGRLDQAIQLNRFHEDALKRRILQLDSPAVRERYFTMMLQRYPDVAMTYIGLPDGQFYGARRNPDGSMDVARNSRDTQGNSDYFAINALGEGTTFLQRFENFDPRKRPWYQNAIKTKQVSFGDLYSHFIFKEPTLTASLPIYENGQLKAVFGVDYMMTWLGETLKKLPIGAHGQVFIVDEQQRLVASSSGEPVFRLIGGKSTNFPAAESTNPVTKAALAQPVDTTTNVFTSFKIDGDEYILGVEHYIYQSIHWNIYTVIARNDFLYETNKTLSAALQTLLILTGLFILYALVLTQQIVKPIVLLNTSAKRLSGGVYEPIGGKPRQDELGELTDSFNIMGGRLTALVNHLEEEVAYRTTQLEEKNVLLKELSYLDELAQIPNRRRFDEFFQQAVELSARNKHPLCLMMLDIDHFKKFNDIYGHVAGDHCIQAVGSVMKHSVHRSIDLTARYGGEEFAVVLLDPSTESAVKIAEAIRAGIFALSLRHAGSEWQVVTISIGLVIGIAEAHHSAENIIQQADAALYKAKEGGRNRIEVAELQAFHPETPPQ